MGEDWIKFRRMPTRRARKKVDFLGRHKSFLCHCNELLVKYSPLRPFSILYSSGSIYGDVTFIQEGRQRQKYFSCYSLHAFLTELIQIALHISYRTIEIPFLFPM